MTEIFDELGLTGTLTPFPASGWSGNELVIDQCLPGMSFAST